MKTKILILLIIFMCSNTFGQRKKIVKKPLSGSPIAKLDKVSAEIFNGKFYIINNTNDAEALLDTIFLKIDVEKSAVLNAKISTINLKQNQFYVISWTENEIVTSKLKTEDITTVFTEICDFSSKMKVFSNFQKTTKIKEVRFLDANQTVSETVDKLRKEGNEINILPDGDVVLINKKGQTKLTYNLADKAYVLKKK